MRLERSFTANMPRKPFLPRSRRFRCSRPACPRRPNGRQHRSRAAQARSTALPRRCSNATGVPSASIAVVQHGKLVYTHAYGSARLASGLLSGSSGHAGDALLHRIHLQAIHGGRHPDAAGARQALPRRPRRQIHSRPHARQRSHHPRNPLAHLRLPGLLARGLRDDADAQGPKLRSKSSTPGPRSRSTSSPARNGNTRTPTSSSPAASSKSSPASRYWDFLTEHIFRPLDMNSVWNSDADEAHCRPTPRLTIATRLAPCAPRPRRASAGCSPPASWP